MSSYASYTDNLHLAAFQSTRGTGNAPLSGNIFNFVFFDTAFREVLSQVQLIPQVSALSKVGLTGVSSQLVNQQQAFLTQGVSNGELSAANPAPSHALVYSGLFFFSKVNSISAKLAASVSSVICSSADTAGRGIAQYSQISSLPDMQVQSGLYNRGNLQYVDLLNFSPLVDSLGGLGYTANSAT